MSEGKDRGEGTFDWLGARRRGEEPEADSEPPRSSPPARRRRTRRGKRNDPAYHQASAYVRKDVYRKVRQTLISEEGGPDYSTLVEMLLLQWLETNGRGVEDPR